jgi:hypothetical protein
MQGYRRDMTEPRLLQTLKELLPPEVLAAIET